jgi:Ca2+-binding EF-hand superfamily protein
LITQRGNNLISVIESYLSLKKVNQQERQELANLFNEIDSDGNGMIDVSEFVEIYKTNVSAYSE